MCNSKCSLAVGNDGNLELFVTDKGVAIPESKRLWHLFSSDGTSNNNTINFSGSILLPANGPCCHLPVFCMLSLRWPRFSFLVCFLCAAWLGGFFRIVNASSTVTQLHVSDCPTHSCLLAQTACVTAFYCFCHLFLAQLPLQSFRCVVQYPWRCPVSFLRAKLLAILVGDPSSCRPMASSRWFSTLTAPSLCNDQTALCYGPQSVKRGYTSAPLALALPS